MTLSNLRVSLQKGDFWTQRLMEERGCDHNNGGEHHLQVKRPGADPLTAFWPPSCETMKACGTLLQRPQETDTMSSPKPSVVSMKQNDFFHLLFLGEKCI